jgi:hypothetical protein
MIRFCLLIVCYWSCFIPVLGQTPTSLETDFIRIDHIGPQDKSLPSILITKVKLKQSFPGEKEIIVTKKIFGDVSIFFSENKYSSTEHGSSEFGQFVIERQISKVKTLGYLSTRNKSITVFKDLRTILVGQEDATKLIAEINHILNFIGARE